MQKVSDISYEDIANYMRIDITEGDTLLKRELETYLNVSKDFISNYTGITIKSDNKNDETLDSYADFIIVVYILCQDMYDNRAMYVDSKNMNRVVETILNMHRRNLI